MFSQLQSFWNEFSSRGKQTGGVIILLTTCIAVSRIPSLAMSKSEATLKPIQIGEVVADISFKDLNGAIHTSPDLARNKVTVFVFLGTHCPVVNSYTSRILEFVKQYNMRGVQIVGVNSNRNEPLEEVIRHAKERTYPFPMVKDVTGVLARRLGARTTPEAVVIDRAGRIRYRGRIDDNVVPNKVKRSDMKAAVDALLAGKHIAKPEGKAFGCTIALPRLD